MEEKVVGRRLIVSLINLQENPTIYPQEINFNKLYNFPLLWKRIKSILRRRNEHFYKN